MIPLPASPKGRRAFTDFSFIGICNADAVGKCICNASVHYKCTCQMQPHSCVPLVASVSFVAERQMRLNGPLRTSSELGEYVDVKHSDFDHDHQQG